MNTVEIRLKLHFSSSVFDVMIQRDFLGNSFTMDPHTHVHPSYEFQYVEKGTCRLVWEQGELRLPQGSVFLIPCHLPHVIHAEEEGAVTQTFFYTPVSSDRAARLARLLSVTEPVSVSDADGFIRTCLLSVRAETQRRNALYRETVRGHLTLLFARLAVLLEPSAEEGREEHEEARAQVIEDYVISHCFDPSASLTELAAQLHLSPRQLHRQCIGFFGVPFRTKLYRTRMEVARFRLEHKGERVAALAQKLGYSSPSAFSSAYKRYFGFSPSESATRGLEEEKYGVK